MKSNTFNKEMEKLYFCNNYVCDLVKIDNLPQGVTR
jgi:hypothetical protein